MRRARTALVLLAAMAAPVAARAVAFGTAPVTIELGDGVRAHRVPVPCAGTLYYGGGRCAQWRTEGLRVPADLPLGAVHMFASARGGRVAMATSVGLYVTDDRGARWLRARIDESVMPLALAFDPASDFGAAVGPNGTVWTTDDRGMTWRARRDRAGPALVDVVVAGRALAFSDAHGGVWVSDDGGFRVRTIAEVARAAMPVMAVHRGVIWIRVEGRRWWRVDATGGVEESDRSPWS